MTAHSVSLDTQQGPVVVPTHSRLESADVAIGAALAGYKDAPVVRGLGTLSQIGDQPQLSAASLAVLACGVLTGDRRLAEAGGRMLASILVATCFKSAAKRVLGRTRPRVLVDKGRYDVALFGPDTGSWQSFPSGHTAGSLAVSRALARVYPAARGPAYGATAAIALVQIPRGAHYPADLIGGALVGWAAEAVVNGAARRLLAADHPSSNEPAATTRAGSGAPR